MPLVALYVFAGQPLVHIFLDSPTGQAMDTGVEFLRIIAPFYFIVSAKLVSDGVLRGAGLMKKFMIATFTDLVLRVALAEVLSRTALGTTGIWISWPIGWDDRSGALDRVLRDCPLGKGLYSGINQQNCL